MEWGTIVGTVLGAVVGVGSTLVADRARWRREQSARDRESKRQLYADYLAALSRTRNEFRSLVRQLDLTVEERAGAAGRSFREGGAYELRYQVALVAPEAVTVNAHQALHWLRDMNDIVEQGVVRGDERWERSHGAFSDALSALRVAMRTDLEVTD
ncbi:hypothetical protein ACFY3E_42075 [Streptomyces griseorubiginosus]|uniref:hypothetical protein n=1 Tax=Streptomyces griseorubiginosus TaxID=67304 RepID=UPI003699977C